MQPICAATLLNGRDTVASARERVLASSLPNVVVLRIEGRVVFWYVLNRESVLSDFQVHSDNDSVKQALRLEHYCSAAPVLDLANPPNSPVTGDTVVLDGSQFIGIRLADASHDPKPSDIARPVGRPRPRPQVLRSKGRLITSIISRELSTTLRPLGLEIRALEKLSDDANLPPLLIDTNPISKSFQAYPRLDAPDVVSPGQHFNITVGLADRSDPNVIGSSFSLRHAVSADRLRLEIVIDADGFTLPKGAHWSLEIDCSAPFAATVQVPLIAPATIADAVLATLRVFFFFENSPCGTAVRKTAVIPTAIPAFSDPQGNGQLWTSGTQAAGNITIQIGGPPIDLTVIISNTDQESGRFAWNFKSSHPSVALPSKAISRNYGRNGEKLGTQLINTISTAESQKTVKEITKGLGRTIANAIPAEFWPLLQAVANAKAADSATGLQLPTLLFYCAEPYIPWELALCDDSYPLLDPAAPPYLGCQTNMARWPNYDSGKPLLPVDTLIEIDQFAVVTGHYADSGLKKLIKAEEEGKTLTTLYNAIPLKARLPAIQELLDVQVPDKNGVQAVHFACHGEAIEDQAIDAVILLEDNKQMSPFMLGGSELAPQCRPFLFLNACQVGKSGEFMGGPAGFSGQSLLGGFRGFVAPLWSVNDEIAHDIALEFYERAFGDLDNPQPVANILRALRQPFANDKTNATRLAYVFFGHPALILKRN